MDFGSSFERGRERGSPGLRAPTKLRQAGQGLGTHNVLGPRGTILRGFIALPGLQSGLISDSKVAGIEELELLPKNPAIPTVSDLKIGGEIETKYTFRSRAAGDDILVSKISFSRQVIVELGVHFVLFFSFP